MPLELAGQSERGFGMGNGGEELRAKQDVLRPKRRKIGERPPERYAILKRHGGKYMRGLERADGVVGIIT